MIARGFNVQEAPQVTARSQVNNRQYTQQTMQAPSSGQQLGQQTDGDVPYSPPVPRTGTGPGSHDWRNPGPRGGPPPRNPTSAPYSSEPVSPLDPNDTFQGTARSPVSARGGRFDAPWQQRPAPQSTGAGVSNHGGYVNPSRAPPPLINTRSSGPDPQSLVSPLTSQERQSRDTRSPVSVFPPEGSYDPFARRPPPPGNPYGSDASYQGRR